MGYNPVTKDHRHPGMALSNIYAPNVYHVVPEKGPPPFLEERFVFQSSFFEGRIVQFWGCSFMENYCEAKSPRRNHITIKTTVFPLLC